MKKPVREATSRTVIRKTIKTFSTGKRKTSHTEISKKRIFLFLTIVNIIFLMFCACRKF